MWVQISFSMRGSHGSCLQVCFPPWSAEPPCWLIRHQFPRSSIGDEFYKLLLYWKKNTSYMPVSTLYITTASKQPETHSECVLIWLKSHTLIVILTSALSSSSELCSSSFSTNGWNHKEMAMFGQSNDLTWCHQCWGMYRISPAFKTTCNQHNPLIKERL